MLRAAGAGLAMLALSACAGGQYRPVADTPVRIGKPYAVRGTTYVPAAAPAYDAVGYASWYGSRSKPHREWREIPSRLDHRRAYHAAAADLCRGDGARQRAADRRARQRPRAIRRRRAHHRPVEGAAEALGAHRQGVVPVRVRRVEPSDKDRARLRKGKACGGARPLATARTGGAARAAGGGER